MVFFFAAVSEETKLCRCEVKKENKYTNNILNVIYIEHCTQLEFKYFQEHFVENVISVTGKRNILRVTSGHVQTMVMLGVEKGY